MFKSNLEEKMGWQIISPSPTREIDFNGPIERVSDKHIQNKSKSSEATLIANVSHEIRTPLNGIIGFTDLLRESELGPEQIEHVNAIQSASHNLLGIINELLEFSKLSSGREKFESIDFNFHSIIKEVMYLCNTLILNKKVAISADVDAHIPEALVGDPSKLSQILLNLLGNAVKFVEEGSISLEVRLKEQKENQYWLEFIVTDTGIGIAGDNLKHIFESYKQAEPDTYVKYGGSGLGLSIVKQIVENLNGNITVSSTLGKGTTFKFILPYGKGNEANLQKRKGNGPLQTEKEQIKDMRILVFEDNPLNQRLIDQRLKVWGCTRYITDNPLYGLNILKNNRIDMVLMDLRMPGMNGYEVTQRIRCNDSAHIKQIPIIALTADFTVRDQEQCDTYGINDFILKPYSPDELLTKIIKNKDTRKKPLGTHFAPEVTLAQPATESSKIDLTGILEECMGEISLLEELVQLYIQNALEFIGQAKIHIRNKDFKGLEFAAHKMKSGLAMMKTMSLHSLMVQIHKTAMEGKDIKHMKFLYNSFLEEYSIVESAIREEVGELRKKG